MSSVPRQVATDNSGLLKETLDAIFDEIIPGNLLPDRLLDAVALKNYTRSQQLNRTIYNKLLLHSSNHLATQIENLELRRTKFLDLLQMFVGEQWKNAQTYNAFIKGFGEGFDDFSD